MRSSTQSRTIDDTLDVPKELKAIGVSHIARKGNLDGSGFVIIFKIKSRSLSLYSKDKRDRTRDELEKTLKKFSKNKDEYTELFLDFEPFVSNNFNWINGKDVKDPSQEDFQESDDFQNNYFEKYLDLNKKDPLLDYKEISIEEVSQTHKGKIKFTGLIHSISNEIPKLSIVSRWSCQSCHIVVEIPFTNILNPPRMPKKCVCSQDTGFDPDHDYISSRLITIEPDDIMRDKAPLSIKVIALNFDTVEVQSSRVTVYGEIENVLDHRLKYSTSYVIAKRIVYHDRQTITIQPEDIPEIIKLSKEKDLPVRLSRMFAPHIKDLYFEKLLIILAGIGAPPTKNQVTDEIKRGPLNIGLIGLPGCGKSELGRSAKPLKPKSKIVSCQYTTQATLCGTVKEENGFTDIKPGIAAKASGGFLILDELDKAKPDFITGLLEIADRCTVTIGKYGEHLEFNADVSIIATLNPRNENWQNSRQLKLSDIPLSNAVISRFDLFLPIRGNRSLQEWKELADFLLKPISKDISIDYELLVKYIQKTQEITTILFDEAAQEIMNSYAAKCAANKDLAYISSTRILLTVHRFCKTFCRMRLSEILTVEIVTEALNFLDQIIRIINLNKDSFIRQTQDPLDIIMNSILKLNPLEHRAITLTNHIEGLCLQNKDLDSAIGMLDKPKLRFKRNSNSTLDTLCDKITQDSGIGVCGSKKEKVYVIRESEEKSPDLESDRDNRDNRARSFADENKKNNDIFDDDTEIEKKATQELEEALNQS